MTTSTLTPDAISWVCTTVRDRSAIELDVSKTYLIEARLCLLQYMALPALMNSFRLSNPGRKIGLESQLVEAMTTNETSFFRDLHPFEAPRKTLLPEIKVRNAASKTLNIWSAACSSGQEIYSIAMHLRKHFADLASWRVQLIGQTFRTTSWPEQRPRSFLRLKSTEVCRHLCWSKIFSVRGCSGN